MEKIMPFIENHFFIGNKESSLYCMEWIPNNENPDKYRGIILCKPMWGERIRTNRIFTNLARAICLKGGFHVITCDYYGDGNSSGDTADMSFEAMNDNVSMMAEYLKTKHKLNSISIVGMRVGALVALSASSNIENVNTIVMIEPLASLKEYLYDLLRANLANQMTVHKKVVRERNELVEDIHNNLLINIDGFEVGKKLWCSFEKIALKEMAFPADCTLDFIFLSPTGKLSPKFLWLPDTFHSSTITTITKEFVWDGWKYYIPAPPVFIETVMSILTRNKDMEQK